MHLQRRSMLVTGAALGLGPALAGATEGRGDHKGEIAGSVLPFVMRQAHVPASVAFAASGVRPHPQLKFDVGADVGLALYGPAAKSWREAAPGCTTDSSRCSASRRRVSILR